MPKNIPINVTINPSGAVQGGKQVTASLKSIEDSAQRVVSATTLLSRALYALGGTYILKQLADYADLWTLSAARIGLVTKNTDELRAVQDRLFESAQRTRASYEATLTIYTRTARAVKGLGYSQEQLLTVTELLNQAGVISGATNREFTNSLIQFSQALASNTLRADELRSVMENFPRLGEAIAVGMGYSARELKTLSVQGKLTTDAIIKAILSQKDAIEKEFAKMPLTIGQSVQLVENSFTRWFGKLNDSRGLARGVAESFRWLANNFEDSMKVMGAAASGLAVILSVKLAQAAKRALASLALFAVTNPFGALLTAAVTLGTLLYNFKDDITVFADSGATLGDTFSAAVSLISEEVGGLASQLKTFVETSIDQFTGIPGSLGKAFDQAGEIFKKAINIIIGLNYFGVKLIQDQWEWFWNSFGGFFTSVGQQFTAFVNNMLEKVAWLVNKVREYFEQAPIELPDAFKDVGKTFKLGQEMGDKLADAAVYGFTTDFVGNTLEALKKQAAFEKLARGIKAETDVDLTDPSAKDKPPVDANAEKELKKLKTAFNSLINEIDNVAEAQRKLSEGETTLQKARNAGLITTDQQIHYLERLKKTYEDALNPIGAINRELQREVDLMKVSQENRETERKLLEINDKLKKAGLEVTEDQLDQFRKQIQLVETLKSQEDLRSEILRDLNATSGHYKNVAEALNVALKNGSISEREHAQATEAVARSLRGVLSPMGDYTRKTAEVVKMFQEGSLTGEEYARALRNTRISYLETQRDFASGAERGILKVIDDLENYAGAMEKVFTKAFTQLEDTLTNFTMTGKLNFKDMAMSIIEDLNRILIRIAVVKPLAAAFGSAIGVTGLTTGVNLPGFATGGSFTVGRQTSLGDVPGRDNRLIAFRARDGERVSVTTPEQERSGSVSAAPISVQLVNNTGQPMDAPRVTSHFDFKKQVIQIVMESTQRNSGNIRRQMFGG